VVVVAHRLQVEQQRLPSLHAQRRGAEQRGFHAMGKAVAQHTPRTAACRTALLFVIADIVIEKALDLLGRSQPAERAQFTSVESVCRCFSSQNR